MVADESLGQSLGTLDADRESQLFVPVVKVEVLDARKPSDVRDRVAAVILKISSDRTPS